MMVKEGEETPAKQSDEAFSGVPSSVSKQYLESVRGHYLSALAGLNTGKQEQINILRNVDAFSALDEDFNAGKTSKQGQLEHIETFTEMDMRIHVSKNVLGAPEKKFQTFKVRLCRTLAKNDEEEISKMVSQIRAFGWEVESETSELEANMTGHSEASDPKESSLKEVPEGSSLQSTVKSLKAQLENLKREHAELKDKGSAAEITSRNMHFKLPKSKFKDACFLSNEAKVRESLDEAVQSHQVEDLKIKNKGLKRRRGTSKVSGEGKKRSRVALHGDEAKDTTVSALVPNKSLPGTMYPACVSTSESSARMISEDKLEASSLKEKTSDKCEREKVMTGVGPADSEKYDSVSEFSIRDYVFASRNRDISLNWPFSQKNLQLCLKHGIKDVLPPFQSMDSLRNSSMKRFVAEPSCNSEESNLHNRPSLLKTHLVTETTMDHHFPSRGEKYLAFKTAVTVNSHSEVESVSTNNLPTSEVSDERVAAVSMVNDKMKSSASQFSDKSQLAVKIRMSNCRSAAEDITSSTVPFEVMNSKICPVCEAFSSSSNTTLNAHIDQCLSSQPSPNWVNNSKFVKPRVKPRKIRLMSDICATAPPCTLEDLDRRNGTNWATNVDVASQNAELVIERKSHKVPSNYDVNNSDDGAVYIDSSGRKIRILSKFNDTLPSPLPKAKNDLGPEKHSKKGKTSRLFSSARKRRLVKHLKYLKANRHKKRFPSLKVNRSPEVCGAEEANTSVRELVQFAKTEEHKNVGDSGSSRQWIPSKISSLSKKMYSTDINGNCRYELRITKERRALDGSSNSARKHIKMHAGTLKKCTFVEQSRMRTPTSSLVVDKKSEISCRNKTSGGSSSIAAIQGNRSLYVVPSGSVDAQFNGTNTKEGVSKSTNSTVSPSASHERQVDIHDHADASEYVDCTFPRTRKLLDSSQTGSNEGIRSQKTKTKSPNFSSVHEDLSNSDRRSSLAKKSFRCRRNEKGDLWSSDSSQQSIGCHDRMMKVQKRQGLKICNDVSRDHNRTDRLGGSRDPELRNIVSECLDEFWGPLFKNNVRTPPDERTPSGDEHATLYKDALGEESLQFETRDSDLHFGCLSFFQEVDPIPIPGPPGSDLPSFSDMGSEDIHRSSSLSGHLGRSSGNGDYVFDGDLSDSPLSATTTISNVGRKYYPTVSQSSKVTRPVSDSFHPGWLGNSSEPVDRTFPSAFFSHFSVTSTERFASLPATSKESVISQKEWIPWSSSVNFEESRILGPSSKVTSSMPRENPPSITPIEVTGASFPKAVVCDSVSPSTPTLRLMGKDLMVINKETVQNASRDTQVPSLCEHSSGFPSWENQTSGGSVLIRPQVHEQDPRAFVTRLFDFGPSNVVNSNPKQASGGMYVNKPMHSTFHNSSTSPLQR